MGITLLPYNRHIGCIMAAQTKLFPAQFRSTSQDGIPHHEKHEKSVHNLITAYVLEDTSIITIESASLARRKLKKYDIQQVARPNDIVHLIDKAPREICSLTSSTDARSALGRIETKASSFLAVCNLRGTVEMIKLTGGPP